MTKNCTCGFEGTPEHNDFYDCVEYYEEKNGKTKGQWMIDWAKRSKKSEAKRKPSGFSAWIDNVEKKDDRDE